MNQDTTVINFTSEDNFLINPIENSERKYQDMEC